MIPDSLVLPNIERDDTRIQTIRRLRTAAPHIPFGGRSVRRQCMSTKKSPDKVSARPDV